MKIKFIGTGTFGSSKRALTSMLINDEILFDMGGGTVRGMQMYDIDMTKIKYVIITHYHIDHWLDLSNFLMHRYVKRIDTPLTVIGPEHIKQVVSNEVDFCMGSTKYLGSTEFVALVDDKIKLGGYEILARSVEHNFTDNRLPNGYEIIEDSHLGFSGDAGECVGLDKIVDNSDVLFLDATRDCNADNSHLNYGGVLDYAKRYPGKQFYLVHRGDYEINNLPPNVFAPNDGEEIEI